MKKLIEGFLELGVSRFTHFSGHTKKLWDEHKGFLIQDNLDSYKQNIVKDALKELEKKYCKQDIYVALEINFEDLEKTKREIEAFHEQYI